MYLGLFGQTGLNGNFFEQILYTDYKSSKSDIEKLNFFYALKSKIEQTKPFNDSAYVLDLLKISKYEFIAQDDYQASINFANAALTVCNTLKKENLKTLKINSYYNLASSYQKLALYRKAISYYDSVIFLCDKSFIDSMDFQLDARYNKADIYFFLGDYQKVIDESVIGMNLSILQKDSSHYLYFLNRHTQSLCFENRLDGTIGNANTAVDIAKKIQNQYELSIAYKILGFIYEQKNILDSAEYFFKESIKVRNTTKDYQQIANDYIDLGNFYLNSLTDYKNSQLCYNRTILFANKIDYSIDRSLKLALANLNLGENFLLQKKFKKASDFFLQSFTNLQINLSNNLKNNPSSIQLSKVSNKDLVIVLMNDKTEFLLEQYKNNFDKTLLTACIQSAIVTDSIVTQIRYEQSGEQTKLYWRNKTRDFYTNAIEASCLENNARLALFFMEKSRAVLLNDKLNELNASSYLSKVDDAKQDFYQIKIVELEQKLSAYADTSQQYRTIQLQFLDVKNEFEQFIKSLEQKYPAYYQYKYADEVPSLQKLQQYLAKKNQSFVYYFMGDTTIYILAITPNSSILKRLSQKDFDKKDLSQFLQFCANKEMLNNHYDAFAELSNSIYKSIFQSLDLPKGRVVICSDNIIIPFEALCTDTGGKNFLLNNYGFSYVYSARFLMKQFESTASRGNFIGFAPVSYAGYLDVNDLKNAADALHTSASYYKKNKLFTHETASKHNFFNYASSYSIISIFSHARADTTDNEPVLFMRDSLIHLSELQLLNDPATKLVILSACQTNVGKSATGEGIYSLARGFATAGIPSVAATLWKADEQTIYSVSAKFNEYLSEGMTKDEALQKAKLYFIQKNDNEKLLPYYWANMIVIGNTDAINLTTASNSYWWWIVTGIFVTLILTFFLFRKKAPVKR